MYDHRPVKLDLNSFQRLERQREVVISLVREAVVAFRTFKDKSRHINLLLDAECEEDIMKNIEALEDSLYYCDSRSLIASIHTGQALNFIKDNRWPRNS